MAEAKYIDIEKCLKNAKIILEKNGKKFNTTQELVNFALENFTFSQIDETIKDMPFCKDKQKFWYASREAFKLSLEKAYRSCWEEVCPEKSYEEQLPVIDNSFDETVGVFNYFFNCVEQNAEMLKKVEECGLGDVFRVIGGA